MAVESVEIVLNGVDNATPAFASVAGEMKKTAETGQKLSGVFSKVFGTLGLSELQSVVNEFSNMSSQIKDLADAGEKGGAAFKGIAAAGMGVTAVVAGWQVGTMIADWIYQTEMWNERIKEVISNFGKQTDFQMEQSKKRFQFDIEMANEAATEEQRLAELKEIKDKKELEVAKEKKELAKQRKELEEALANDMFGWGTEDNELAKEAVKQAEKRLELAKEQAAEVSREIEGPTEREQELADRKKAREENKQAIEDERKALQDRWQEFSKDLLAKQKEAEDQKKRDKDFLDAIKARNKELTEGKRAAEAFQAELKGITAETILAGQAMEIENDLLTAQAELAKQQQEEEKKRKEAFAQPTAPLQAMQSRLLSRVSSSGGDRVAKASEKTAELTEQIEKLQREQLDLQKRRGITELAVVEG